MKNPILTFVAGLIAGAATGIIIGTLYAPQKGIKTRRQIKQKAHDFQEKVDELQDRISEKIDDIHQKVSGKVEDLKHSAEKKAEDAKAKTVVAEQKNCE